MKNRQDTRSRKTRKTRAPLSPQVTGQIMVALFAYLPMAIGLFVAWWAGWGVDGWLFSAMTGGILGGALLLVLFLLWASPRKRKPGRARR